MVCCFIDSVHTVFVMFANMSLYLYIFETATHNLLNCNKPFSVIAAMQCQQHVTQLG